MKSRKTSIFFVAVLLAMMFAAAVPGSVSAEGTCPEGLVSYWRFDDGAGNVAVDSTGLNEGSIIGATWTTGQVGGALSFDGDDDYVSIPASGSLGGMAALTLESWFYVESYPTPWVPITPHATSTGTPFELAYGLHYNTGTEVPGGGFRAHVGTSANSPKSWYHLDIQKPLMTNTWYYTAQVYDGSNLIVYLDGQEIGMLPGVTGTVRDVFDPVIGRAWLNNDGSWTPGGSWKLDGLMDEVAIWDRALEPSEIIQHHENGLDGKGYCESGGGGDLVDVEVELEEITFKAKIDRDRIDVIFNPGKLNVEKTVPWKEHPRTGTPWTEFTNGKPFKLKMDIFVDEAGVEGGDINLAIFAFEYYIELNKDVKKPEVIKFDWGTMKYDAILEKMDVTYELFKPDGTPLRAKMSCTFKEYSPASEQLKQAPRH